MATDQAEFSRLQLNVDRINMKKEGDCGECASADVDHIQILDPLRPGDASSVACISSCQDERSLPLKFFSRGPYLSLVLSVAAKSSLANYFKSEEPIFEARGAIQ